MPQQAQSRATAFQPATVFDALYGERVIVRPLRLKDAREHYQAVDLSREHLYPWLPWVSGYRSEKDSEKYIRVTMRHWRLRQDFAVGIWERENGKFVGGSGLHPADGNVPSFEIGYWLRGDATGRGYMTEAVRLLTDFAFDAWHARRVFIRCDARNQRSAGVALRLGFVFEGRFRNDRIACDGVLTDTLYYSMTPADRQ